MAEPKPPDISSSTPTQELKVLSSDASSTPDNISQFRRPEPFQVAKSNEELGPRMRLSRTPQEPKPISNKEVYGIPNANTRDPESVTKKQAMLDTKAIGHMYEEGNDPSSRLREHYLTGINRDKGSEEPEYEWQMTKPLPQAALAQSSEDAFARLNASVNRLNDLHESNVDAWRLAGHLRGTSSSVEGDPRVKNRPVEEIMKEYASSTGEAPQPESTPVLSEQAQQKLSDRIKAWNKGKVGTAARIGVLAAALIRGSLFEFKQPEYIPHPVLPPSITEVAKAVPNVEPTTTVTPESVASQPATVPLAETSIPEPTEATTPERGVSSPDTTVTPTPSATSEPKQDEPPASTPAISVTPETTPSPEPTATQQPISSPIAEPIEAPGVPFTSGESLGSENETIGQGIVPDNSTTPPGSEGPESIGNPENDLVKKVEIKEGENLGKKIKEVFPEFGTGTTETRAKEGNIALATIMLNYDTLSQTHTSMTEEQYPSKEELYQLYSDAKGQDPTKSEKAIHTLYHYMSWQLPGQEFQIPLPGKEVDIVKTYENQNPITPPEDQQTIGQADLTNNTKNPNNEISSTDSALSDAQKAETQVEKKDGPFGRMIGWFRRRKKL